jgi:biopolymer transport protein TolR
MLVLLIIFMISAPLLTSGVELELPKAEAPALQNQQEPITVSIKADGAIFVGETQVAVRRTWVPAHERPSPATAMTSRSSCGPTARRPTPSVAQVTAALSNANFTKINLLTDTGGPSSGATAEG